MRLPDSTPIENILSVLPDGISIRIRNCMLNAQLVTVGDVRRCGVDRLLKMPNFGRKCLHYVAKAIGGWELDDGTGFTQVDAAPLLLAAAQAMRREASRLERLAVVGSAETEIIADLMDQISELKYRLRLSA